MGRSSKPLYQVMPDCSSWEDSQLEADILDRGIIVPLIKDTQGNIVDGHRRQRIADKHKIKHVPVKTISGLDKDELRQLALELNCKRRQLTTKQKQELVQQELRLAPTRTDRWIGDLLGVDGKTVAKERRHLESYAEIPHTEEREFQDGRRRKFRQIFTYTKTGEVQAQKFLERHGEKLPTGHTSYQQIRLSRLDKLEPVVQDGNTKLYHCDFRDLPVEDGSVDVVFCDPPYHKTWLSNWVELGEWAAKKLKPSGVFAAYFGVWHLPDVVASLGQHLAFHWQCVIKFDSDQASPLFQRRVSGRYRGMLLYCNGEWRKDTPFIPDFYEEARKEKALHRYQQGQVGVEYYLNLLTKPGFTVVDPCMGSGTTGAACLALQKGLQFIGCDIDKEIVGIARKRLGK